MRPRLALGISLACALASAFVLPVGPASAYHLEGCRFASNLVGYQDGTAYSTATAEATAAWTNTSTSIQLIKVSTAAALLLDSQNFGNSGYNGITYTYGCNGSNHWSSPPISFYNTYFTSGYGTTGAQTGHGA